MRVLWHCRAAPKERSRPARNNWMPLSNGRFPSVRVGSEDAKPHDVARRSRKIIEDGPRRRRPSIAARPTTTSAIRENEIADLTVRREARARPEIRDWLNPMALGDVPCASGAPTQACQVELDIPRALRPRLALSGQSECELIEAACGWPVSSTSAEPSDGEQFRRGKLIVTEPLLSLSGIPPRTPGRRSSWRGEGRLRSAPPILTRHEARSAR